jgi:hypothetical protein
MKEQLKPLREIPLAPPAVRHVDHGTKSDT